MNGTQPTFGEFIDIATDRLESVIAHVASVGIGTHPNAILVQARWLGVTRATAAVVATLMPDHRYDSLNAAGPYVLEPLPAAALRYATAMRQVHDACGRRRDYDDTPLSGLETGVEAAYRAIGAAGDILASNHVSPDDALMLMAKTAPLVHVLAQSQYLFRGGLLVRSLKVKLPDMYFADTAGAQLAALAGTAEAAAVGRALAMPARVIRTDSIGHEFVDRCAAIAAHINDQLVRGTMTSVRLAGLVARAQLITCTLQQDAKGVKQWLAVNQGLRRRGSVYGIDPELAAHDYRLHQMFQSIGPNGDGPDAAELHEASKQARIHLDRAANDLGEIADRGHIDQWVPGKPQRPYLARMSGAAFMPQRVSVPLPAMPVPPTPAPAATPPSVGSGLS